MDPESCITSKEKTHIEELRLRMKDSMNDEFYKDDTLFRRFLRARNFNIDSAEEMLRKNLEWRRINKIDTITTDYTPPEIIDKYFAHCQIGYDKEGAPLLYIDFGNIDFRGILNCVETQDAIQHFMYEFENAIHRIKESSVKLGKLVEQFTYIANMENFSLRTATNRPTIEFMVRTVTLFDANYPERLKNVFVVNAPVYFTLFSSVIFPFLTGTTARKIKIYGKDHWKEVLLENIAAEVLPAFLGGNRTDPDGNPECKTFIKTGKPVPKQYYTTKKNSDFCRQPNTKHLTVDRRSKAEVRRYILNQDTKIEYEFYVQNRDISFAVLYCKDESNMAEVEEVIPKQRMQTDVTTETGIFSCSKSGTYILEFDNTHSWIYQKQIFYVISIVSSNNQKSAAD